MFGLWADAAVAVFSATFGGKCLPGFHKWKPLYRLSDIRNAEAGKVIRSHRHLCVKCKAVRQ